MVTYTSGVNSSLRNSGVYTTGINVVNQQSPDATIQPVRPELSQSSISGKASTQTINGIYRSGASTSGTYTSGTGSAGTYRSGASTSSTYTSGTGSAGTYRSGASTSGTYTSGTSSAGTYRSGVSTSGTYTSRTSSAGLSSTFSSFAHAGATLSQNIDRIVSSNVPTTESVPLSSQPSIGFSQNNGLVPNPNYSTGVNTHTTGSGVTQPSNVNSTNTGSSANSNTQDGSQLTDEKTENSTGIGDEQTSSINSNESNVNNEQLNSSDITATNSNYDGPKLTPELGVVEGPSGKETYYNMPMEGVIQLVKNECGIDSKYWVREDGVKMYGDYVMVAANFDYYPRGTIVQTSLGPGLVCDTGGMEGTHIDIAVNWGKEVTWEG